MANPGCYPTAAALAVSPFLKRGMVADDPIVINAASGVSGAGRSVRPQLQFVEQDQAFGPYGQIGHHRHQPEIEQTLSTVSRQPDSCGVRTTFAADRAWALLRASTSNQSDPNISEKELFDAMSEDYEGEPFVRIRHELPNVKHVLGTNFCDVTVRLVGSPQQRRVVVFTAIDNMIKGASGQAIQNMNAVYGLSETIGLL